MKNTDVTLSKIRKLLTLAENPAATTAESEAFTAKATQLMADYGIDQALLTHDLPGRRTIQNRMIALYAPYARDKSTLLVTIAHRTRCKTVTVHKGSAISVHVFGHEADLLCVEILLTSLLLQGSQALARTPVPWGEHVAAYRRSWWYGFTTAISHRLFEAERRSVQESDQRRHVDAVSAAVVLADHSREAEDAMNEAYPLLRNATPRRLSGGGSRDGFASGQRANLNVRSSVDRHGRSALTG